MLLRMNYHYFLLYLYFYIHSYSMKRIIYSLKCPFTKEIHYIGKSTHEVVRPSQHLSESHSEKIKDWVESLRIINSAPEIEILEYVQDNVNLDERERYYIRKYLSNGNILLNSILYNSNLIIDKHKEHLEDSCEININEVSKAVKVRRRQIGLTQEEFAEKAGVALTVVRKIEQGNINVNLTSLLTVLSMFGYGLSIKKI